MMGGNKTPPTEQQTRKEPPRTKPISSNNVGSNQIGSVCLRLISALFPVMGCGIILIVLYLLIHQEGGKVPAETSVSQAMADYEPQQDIFVLILLGGTFLIIATMSRNIQIRVSFTRDGMFTPCLKVTNFISTLANILAYLAFVLLARFNIDSEVELEAQLHGIGSYMFFTLASFWGILQSSILFKQKQYPWFIKILLLLVNVAELGTIIGYVILGEEAYLLEWISVALIAFYIGLFFVLFAIDPVDDELIAFFCCCCRRRGRKGVAERSDGKPKNNGRLATASIPAAVASASHSDGKPVNNGRATSALITSPPPPTAAASTKKSDVKLVNNGRAATAAATTTTTPNKSYTKNSYRPPPHSITWREFHARPISRYNPPPIGMQSVPHTPRWLVSGGISPNGRHKALLIGINYTGTQSALRGCINDAKNMQTLLLRNGFPNDGSHMLMLTDEPHRGNEYQPNASNIMKAMAWLMQGAQRGDVLFFSYSGHGDQVPDKTGHEADGCNETIVPVDHSIAGQITDDVLWGSLVYNLPEGARLTALMDMCHSGTGLDLPFEYDPNNRRWTEGIDPAHSRGDVVLFSGCEDSQQSADVNTLSGAGGAMTMAFTKAYMQRPMTTYHEFLCVVKSELRESRHSQRPQLTSSQRFDASSRIFSLGQETEGGGGIPSMIEPNHNPQVGRQKRRHVRPARQGFGKRFGI